MKTFDLEAKLREGAGKKASKKLRQQDLVPAVLYGGKENLQLACDTKKLNKVIYTPHVYIIKLAVEGKGTLNCIVKDLQFHPVTDKVLHVDFYEISDDKKVEINIPVKLEGIAEGVKAGGKLQQNKRTLTVKAFHKDLPDTLNIDVAHVKLGQTIKVRELSFENLEFLTPKDSVVASVNLTRASKGEDDLEEVTATEETTTTTTTTE